METDIRILRALIDDPKAFINGQELAGTLQMSRVGVWKRLRKLEKAGLKIEAVRNRGYRIQSEPPAPMEALMRAWLDRETVDMPVFWHQSIGSTNTEAERLLAEGQATPFAVASAEQTTGRGRMGRSWHSPAEGNLYISFAFRPGIQPRRMQSITLFLGLRICKFLNQRYNLPVRIKWPNDLMLHGKKVCGILTEARVDADTIRDLVFGMGLNINSRVDRWPEEVRNMASSLAAENGEALPFHELSALIAGLVEESYQHFLIDPENPKLLEDWPQYDFLHSRQLAFEHNHRRFDGTAEGINPQGQLIVRETNGTRHALSAGEVSIGSGRV